MQKETTGAVIVPEVRLFFALVGRREALALSDVTRDGMGHCAMQWVSGAAQVGADSRAVRTQSTAMGCGAAATASSATAATRTTTMTDGSA